MRRCDVGDCHECLYGDPGPCCISRHCKMFKQVDGQFHTCMCLQDTELEYCENFVQATKCETCSKECEHRSIGVCFIQRLGTVQEDIK